MARNEEKPANEPTKQALLDTDHAFSAEELQTMIDGEFAEDGDSVDMALIDLATSRLLLLQGEPLTEENLRRAQEKNAKRVLSRVLGISNIE